MLLISEQDRKIEILQENLWHLPSQRGFARFRRFLFINSPACILIVYFRHSFKSDYKLKRETVYLFQLANEAYGMQRRRRSVRSLRVAFALFGDEFPKAYPQLIIGALKQTLRDPTRRNELSDEIFDATKAIAIDSTDSTGWYQLSRGLFSVGYFRAAWFARDNSVELSMLKGEGEGVGATAVWRAIQANLERRNFSEAEALITTSNVKDSLIHETRNYLDLMQKKFLMPGFDSNSPYFDAEVLFNNLITGKTVALVGSGSPSGYFGDEIDSADTVVRTKYIGREHLPPPEFQGHRCDISATPRVDSLVSVTEAGSVCEFLDDLKLLLGKAVWSKGLVLSVPVRQLSVASPVFGTTSTLGIRTIFQILLSKPQSLKIYGFDFYSKREQYPSSMFQLSVINAIILGDNQSDAFYTRDGGVSECEISKSFSAHDPVSNFCFAQNLYKAGLFDIEPYGKSILELTPYQYVERLEEMLGDW